MKNYFTLYFVNVEQVHLGKDVFLTPYYLGKDLGCKVRIIYPMKDSNMGLPKMHRGVRLIPISWKGKPIKNRYLRQLMILLYIIRYMVPSKYGMLFHYYRMDTVYYGLIYKLLNPFGKLYLKLDADITAIKAEDDYRNIIEYRFKDFCHWLFSKAVDCVSCETTIARDFILNSKATCYKFRENMILMPNGFDEEELINAGIKVKTFDEKENIFITVGRIGTYQKNNEMLLEALKGMDLKDWKFYIIGSIEDAFIPKIERFYTERPDLKEKVVFTGNISSKKELWEYYNRSKVFVLTSRFESFALVLYEAARFDHFIVTTKVGTIEDLIDIGYGGIVIENGNVYSLSNTLCRIIDGSCITSKKTLCPDNLSWAKMVESIAGKLKQ